MKRVIDKAMIKRKWYDKYSAIFWSYSVFGILLLSVLMPAQGYAQETDDLYIFGFSQTLFNHKNISTKAFPYPEDNPINGVPFEFEREFKSNTFALHQINLFFRKPINDKTTFFLNLEATGSYSDQRESGNFQIPEGWLSYQFNPQIQAKVGLLVPRFNNLNEIKNRLPLFPYIIRPTIYEEFFNGIVKQEDYIPQSAYVQLTGDAPLTNRFLLDFAAYIGNSEPSYASTVRPGDGALDKPESATIYRGENLTTKLMFGGRVGVTSLRGDFKFGVSGTIDHDDRNEISQGSIAKFAGIVLPAFGDVRRYRLGLDLSFNLSRFDFESEYIGVFHDHSEIHETPQYRNVNLNKHFYYGLLTYNINEQYYLFSGYNEFQDTSFNFLIPNSPDAAGVKYISAGGGVKLADGVVFKGQFSRVYLGDNPHADVKVTFLTAGVSVIF